MLHKDKDLSTSRPFYKSVRYDSHSNTQYIKTRIQIREREGGGETETERQTETDIQRQRKRQTDRQRQTRGLVAHPTAAEGSYSGGILQKMTTTL